MTHQFKVQDLFGFVQQRGQWLLQRPDASLEAELLQSFAPFLQEFLPGSGLLGQAEAEWTWWLEPVDGLVNFEHGWPHSAISLALYRRDQPHLALIHDPYLRETFWAQKDQGAWCGPTRLQISPLSDLGSALVACDLGKEGWSALGGLQRQVRGLRLSGCPSLDLAYVACGRVQACCLKRPKPTAVAAGLLLVQEAGGQVSDGSGLPAHPRSPRLLAGSAPLLKLLQSEFRLV